MINNINSVDKGKIEAVKDIPQHLPPLRVFFIMQQPATFLI